MTAPVLPLSEVAARWLPWSEPGVAWAGQESWGLHARRLWTDEPDRMAAFSQYMADVDGWPHGPVVTHDGFVQDGHHRIVVALGLGWHDRPIPVHVLEVNA